MQAWQSRKHGRRILRVDMQKGRDVHGMCVCVCVSARASGLRRCTTHTQDPSERQPRVGSRVGIVVIIIVIIIVLRRARPQLAARMRRDRGLRATNDPECPRRVASAHIAECPKLPADLHEHRWIRPMPCKRVPGGANAIDCSCQRPVHSVLESPKRELQTWSAKHHSLQWLMSLGPCFLSRH